MREETRQELSVELIKAVIRKKTKRCEELLAMGADPNFYEDQDMLTPLHYAVSFEAFDCLALLLTAGADPSAETIEGYTPLEMAIELKYERAISLMKNSSGKHWV